LGYFAAVLTPRVAEALALVDRASAIVYRGIAQLGSPPRRVPRLPVGRAPALADLVLISKLLKVWAFLAPGLRRRS
jgi:hypothetical protein